MALAIVICICPDRGNSQSGAPGLTEQSQQQNQSTSQSKSNPPSDGLKAEPSPRENRIYIYKSACGETSNHDEADLCEQRRMAQAAVDAVWWAAWQTKLSAAGFVAVALSLFFTGWAAIVASDAAKAAQASVQIASENAERELRAYISMSPETLGGLFAGGITRVQFLPKNHGITPAYAIVHEFGMGVFPSPLPDGFEYPKPAGIVRTENAIYPDSVERCWFDLHGPTQKEIDAIAVGTMRFHCWGTTRFRDIFRKERRVHFRISAGGQNVIDAQEQYKAGKRDGLPEWGWAYERGHNNSD